MLSADILSSRDHGVVAEYPLNWRTACRRRLETGGPASGLNGDQDRKGRRTPMGLAQRSFVFRSHLHLVARWAWG